MLDANRIASFKASSTYVSLKRFIKTRKYASFKILWYEIKKILGQGGFGITYLALDEKLDRYLAVKEYFSSEIVTRENYTLVHPQSEDEEELYQWGLERFLNEGKTLAKFTFLSNEYIYVNCIPPNDMRHL